MMSQGDDLKNNRKLCYKSRDEYFVCLDRNQDDESKCRAESKDYRNNCPASWVDHFIRKRGVDKYREELVKKGIMSEDDKNNTVKFNDDQ